MSTFPTSEDDLALALRTPQYWINCANTLRASAAAIWYCMHSNPPIDLSSSLSSDVPITGNLSNVYRMLCGMSLELAYKASLVAMGENVKTTHDLTWLAERVLSSVSRKERGLLELLAQSVVWEGRYPVPKDALSLEYFVYLWYENLYRPERRSDTMTVLKLIEPDPLNWEKYDELWRSAIAAYEWHSS